MDKYLKRIYAAVLVFCVMFAWQLISDSGKYHGAVKNIAGGEYEAALEALEELDTYQDSEVLAEYCRIMAEYDATNYASVFRSYHRLKGLSIDNEALAVETAASRAEITALYTHYPMPEVVCGG